MASDASAIVEHTKQVIFLEDDDVVFVEDGTLSIHRISKHPTDGQANDVQKREVISLNMELQEIMKVGMNRWNIQIPTILTKLTISSDFRR